MICPTTSEYLTHYCTIKKYTDDYYVLTIHKKFVKHGGFETDNLFKNRDVNDFKLENNISRARSKVFEYAICNEFEYFVTLTLDSKKYDRYNLELFIKDLGQFIRDKRKKYNTNIQYLLVPEIHNDGAWHMHGLIKGIPSDALSINKNGYLDWEEYKKKFGYISLSKVKNQEAVSKYITKYIRKNIGTQKGVIEKNKKMYYCSRGLKKAEKKQGMYNAIPEKFEFDYENIYIRKKVFHANDYNMIVTQFQIHGLGN